MRSELIEAHITRRPDILGGKPIIRGTRVPVYIIVDLANNGSTIEEIVEDYPDLSIDDVKAARAFAEENPDGYRHATIDTEEATLDLANRPSRRIEVRPW